MSNPNNNPEKSIDNLKKEGVEGEDVKGGFGVVDGKVDFVILTDPTGTQVKVGELMDPIVTNYVPTPIQNMDVNMDLEDQTLDS